MQTSMQLEIEFYTPALDMVGTYYSRQGESAVQYPDLLFFCCFVTRLLVERRLPLGDAERLKQAIGKGALLEDALSDRPYNYAEFRGGGRPTISASLLMDKSVHFRFGRFGVGMFSRYRRRFGEIATRAFRAMLDIVYEKYKDDAALKDMLWRAASAIGALKFGKELNNGNYVRAAQRVYGDITGETIPV